MPVTDELRARWREMLIFVEDYGDLNEWEAEFVDNVSILLSGNKDLTFKQSCKLRQIFQKAMEDYAV